MSRKEDVCLRRFLWDSLFMIVLAFFVRILHAFYVAFVAGAPALILALKMSSHRWLFRIWWTHLGCVAFVLLQFGLGWPCPLTLFENYLRGLPLDASFVPMDWQFAPAVVTGGMVFLIGTYLIFSLWWLSQSFTLKP